MTTKTICDLLAVDAYGALMTRAEIESIAREICLIHNNKAVPNADSD